MPCNISSIKRKSEHCMKPIESLIPHRDPFLYVDTIISATMEEIVGLKVFSDTDPLISGSFPEFNFVPGVILLESMAQCGGAGVKILGVTEGFFALSSIESAHFPRGAEIGQQIKMVIKNIKLSERFIKQSGIAYVANKVVADATWLCVRLD